MYLNVRHFSLPSFGWFAAWLVGFFLPSECNTFSSLKWFVLGARIARPQEHPLLRAASDTNTLRSVTVKSGSFPGQKSSLAVWAHGIPGNRATTPAGMSSHNRETNQGDCMCLADVLFRPHMRLLGSFKKSFLMLHLCCNALGLGSAGSV